MKASVARQAIASLADVVVQGLALAFLYGYLLRALGAEQVGLWSVVFSITAIGRAADLGLSRGLIRYVPVQTTTQDRRSALVDAAAIGTLILIVPLCLLAGAALWLMLPLTLSQNIDAAQSLVPWALLLLALMSMGQVYLNALIAVFRSDLRSYVNIVATLFMLAATVVLTPTQGLIGVVWAQIIQHVSVILLAALMLRGVLPGFRLIPLRGTRADMQLLFSYGIKLHAAGLAMLLFEPATRIIMARIGSLDAVAYYDMASRLLQQVRNLIVMTNQVMSPYFSRMSETSRIDLTATYRSALSMTAFFALPIMALLVAGAPLVGLLWIGKSNDLFVLFVAMLGIGWTINILSAPSYFLATSTGFLAPVIISHVLISAGSSVLAYGLGLMVGEAGVVLGVSLGLAAGSIYCMYEVHGQALERSGRLWQAIHIRFFSLCILGAGAGLAGYYLFLQSFGDLSRSLIMLAVGAVVISVAILTNPDVRSMGSYVQMALKSTGRNESG